MRRPQFSRRTAWDLGENQLSGLIAEAKAGGRALIDLTESNPTRCHLAPVEPLVARLGHPRGTTYAPVALGHPEARRAVARYYEERGLRVDADRVVLCASTSEAYGWLFKLLCERGDRVLIPAPSYPLLEYLANLEDVALATYPLLRDERFRIDTDALAQAARGHADTDTDTDADADTDAGAGAEAGTEAGAETGAEAGTGAGTEAGTEAGAEAGTEAGAGAGTEAGAGAHKGVGSSTDTGSGVRAIVMVHPNNPTGSFVRRDDAEAVEALAERLGLALIVDEVFGDYAHGPLHPSRLPSFAGRDRALTFVLSGLSKVVALPQLKLGWIAVSGPPALVAEAMQRLEVIADTYLSVSTPVQLALPEILEVRGPIQRAILERVTTNLAALDAAIAHTGGTSAVRRLPTDGGWYAILDVPRTIDEDAWVELLLCEDGIVVHPGYFFDMEAEGSIVVSLLPDPHAFADAAARIVARVGKHIGDHA